jgi:UDP-3-O-[3-hydroxymyristoyl] glucosamine N-acyltransferase
VGGYPAVPIRQWHRQTAALRGEAGDTDGQGDEDK